ncbi:hypothetical protein DESA109040_02200 [Deinococcus saxicola]|uniref:fimbrial biogenesis chaperone n=1 Tax=Deinococcus saxicola TaxID=249406 RepID=UPI0039EF1BFC
MRSLLHLLCAAAALLPLGGVASAASFAVSPTRLVLSNTVVTSALTLSNSTAAPSTVRVDVMVWSQVDGKDVLTPTTDVLAVPPVFTLPANGKQVVRLALRDRTDIGAERSYRLVLQEVPPEQTAPAAGSALNVVLRLSVPVFVQTAAVAAPRPEWKASITGESLKLSVLNAGNAHVQVTGLNLQLPGMTTPLLDVPVFSYVLPGQSLTWTFPLPVGLKPGTPLDLSAKTDMGPFRAPVLTSP